MESWSGLVKSLHIFVGVGIMTDILLWASLYYYYTLVFYRMRFLSHPILITKGFLFKSLSVSFAILRPRL